MKAKKQTFYTFTLVLSNVTEETPNLEDSLFEAGCDDALINIRNGRVFLDFDREAKTLKHAVISAINDVESSSVNARVISVGPEDLVTEAEIAARLHKTRQTVSLWIQAKRRSKTPFPLPFMKLTSRSPLWYWHEVVTWLFNQQIIKEKNMLEEAEFFREINFVLEERLNPDVVYKRKTLLEQLIIGVSDKAVNQ